MKCAVLFVYVSESSVSVGVQLFSSACNSEVNRCALILAPVAYAVQVDAAAGGRGNGEVAAV